MLAQVAPRAPPREGKGARECVWDADVRGRYCARQMLCEAETEYLPLTY
jgi:hypothetical protein